MSKLVRSGILFAFIFGVVALVMYILSLYAEANNKKEIFETISIGFAIAAGVLLFVCFSYWGYIENTKDKVELDLKKKLSDLIQKQKDIEKNIRNTLSNLNDSRYITEQSANHSTSQARTINDVNKLQKEETDAMNQYYSIKSQLYDYRRSKKIS